MNRRPLGSIRARVIVLIIVSTLPLMIVALVFASRRAGFAHDALLLIGAGFLGMGCAVAATGRAVGRPLQLLADAVEHWKGGGPFEASNLSLPIEVVHVAQAFSDATKALADHDVQLRAATVQQELLMREIHHRVKNNLQIVASLLSLQANRIRSPAARAEFFSARDRVRALGTLHRHLYSEEGLHSINMPIFLTELCGQLFEAMGEREGDRIGLTIEASEVEVSSDQAVPLSLIVTEAVSNALKYAFPAGRKGQIAVHLGVLSGMAFLSIHDDGIGIPEGAGESGTGPSDGLGIQLIRGFARQLGATLEVRQGPGIQYDLRIPLRPGAAGGAGSGPSDGTVAV